ncbi:MAG: hypothetical protein ACRBDL_11195 [Alphaproteobacteria bacterium]
MSEVFDRLNNGYYKERDAKIACVTLFQDFNREYQGVQDTLSLVQTVSRNFSHAARQGNIVEAAHFIAPRHGLVFGLVKDLERKCEQMNALQSQIGDNAEDIADYESDSKAVWSHGLSYKQAYDENAEKYSNFQERMSAVSDGLAQVGHIATDEDLSIDDLNDILRSLSDDLERLQDGQVNDFAL